MLEKRSLTSFVERDLEKKMVFLSGPRQAGKTTFAKELLRSRSGVYYNYDDDKDRRTLLKGDLDSDARLWVLDEIHKYSRWRNWLKGLFDTRREKHQFLVTGSAKLDVYSRSGDSLRGRYFHYRFHPFTLGEVLGNPVIDRTPDQMLEDIADGVRAGAREGIEGLLRFGPFPEPFSSQSDVEAGRWHLGYSRQVIREEIAQLEQLKDLAHLEMLYDRLLETVGSPLSLNSVREDLEVSYDSVKRWLEIFERLFLSFRISPFGPPRVKAVKKEQKLYLWNYATVAERSLRLENLVASHLLRFTHWCEDVYGQPCELRYYRDVDGHEVDFVVLRAKKPWFCVEVKQKEQPLSPNLAYLLKRSSIPLAFQIHLEGEKHVEVPLAGAKTRVRVMPVHRFLAGLP